MNIINPRQFAFHDRVSKTAPSFDMFDKLANNPEKKLTREEKDTIFERVYNQHYNGCYRLGGWSYDFKQFMKRFLVKYNYNNHFNEIWAFDKMCIRNCDYTKNDISEIIEIQAKK